MTFDDAIDAYLNAAPSWMRPKPCAVCQDEFMPADPRQECCPEHHRALIESVRLGLQESDDAR